ncbi:flagellar hook-length control protein FliK [Salinarimonas soli]|uniref:Flagellar hook-length control protein-like C-terminal domain-containing protein n=1 Tax=Salinarimonas soli TaxID=1638099 RepID=A0A5B2VGS8_9HYPH|nr:flagellar hook-length control protein FliK [Salinarimonas soli]KAA2237377.1 hypothetical protein F0L46_10280 [Salinarimonas soli]
MTRVDVPTTAPIRGHAGAASTEAGAGEAFERCFPAPSDKHGGREGKGKAKTAPQGEMLVEAAGETAPPPKAMSALNALVFDLGRGAPPIREPGLPLDQASAPDEAAGNDALAGLLAQAVAAVTPGEPQAKRGTAEADGAREPRRGTTDAPAVGTDAQPAGSRPGVRLSGPLMRGTADLALAVKASAGEAPMKATVLSQATFFAPALGAANVQAIADAVSGAAPDRAPLHFAPTLASTDPLARGSASPVKVLTVQLEPISLGKVTLAIRLTADGVRVDVTAADPSVVPLLNQDKDLITDAIRRSGVVPDVVTIQAGEPPARLHAPGVQAPSGGDGAAAGGASGGREGMPGGGSDRRDHPGNGAQARRAQDEDDLGRRRDTRGDLYL